MSLNAISTIKSYLDLNRPAPDLDFGPQTFADRSTHPSASSKGRPRTMPLSEQLTMYLGTTVGVLFSAAINHPGPDGALQFSTIHLTTLIIALVIALAIMPLEYKQLQIKPSTPFMVRLGLFVQSGVFWQVFLSLGQTALK